MPELQKHLIGRLTGRVFDGAEAEYTTAETLGLKILDDKIYFHKTMRVNYTSYDMRRNQDTVTVRTRPDIMVLGHDDENDGDTHPYWYGRVLTIFHLQARYIPPGAKNAHQIRFQKVDVLYVRWFGRDTSVKGGFGSRRPHLIGFVESSLPDAFGFLDPQEVIRGAHIIPAFRYGKTSELLGPSVIRYQDPEREEADHQDWRFYNVNS